MITSDVIVASLLETWYRCCPLGWESVSR